MKALCLWLAAALTIFANGLLHGAVAGLAGATAAFKAGGAPRTVLITGIMIAATNGGKRVLVWSDANPIPNPFPGWVTPVDNPSATPAAAAPAPQPNTGS
jgi:hypothetical protein